MITEITLVRRCLWCVNRIGQARYFLLGEWLIAPSADPNQPYTDGLCPDCHKAELEKLKPKQIDERSVVFPASILNRANRR